MHGGWNASCLCTSSPVFLRVEEMKHGVRIWQKKLTSSGAHNRALLLNQATDLVTNGRITTTVAKAKVLKHYAEKIINIAKQDNLTKLNKVVFRPETTVPKLQLLAARFADRTGGYTRLTLAGFNRPGSDRAPLATLEYVDSPNDSVHFLAERHLPKLREDLASLQARKYNTKSFQIEDPTSPGRIMTVLKRTVRSDVNAKQIKQMAVKERHLQSLIAKFERSGKTFERARAVEATFEATWEAKSDAAATSTLRELQAQVDEMSHRERVAFVDKYNADRKDAKNVASALGGRILRMQITGELFWDMQVIVKKKVEAVPAPVERKTAPSATVTTEETDISKSNEEKKRAPAKGALGMMSKWMKSWSGR